jgi:hypothetical protein
MLSDLVVGVSDFERALAFYRALLPVLGIQERPTATGHTSATPKATSPGLATKADAVRCESGPPLSKIPAHDRRRSGAPRHRTHR